MVSLRESLRKFSLRLPVLITDMGFVLKTFSQHHLSSFFIELLLDKVFFFDNQDYMNIRSKCQLNGVVFENLQTFRKMRVCKSANAYETGDFTPSRSCVLFSAYRLEALHFSVTRHNKFLL